MATAVRVWALPGLMYELQTRLVFPAGPRTCHFSKEPGVLSLETVLEAKIWVPGTCHRTWTQICCHAASCQTAVLSRT